MKKLLWLSAAFTIALGMCIGGAVFADEEAKCIGDNSGLTKCGEATRQQATNCVGDTSGQTNCLDASQPGLSVDLEAISFGQITEKGRSYTKTIVITNNSGEKKTVQIAALAYDENPDLSMADWVAFVGGRRKYEINAGDSARVGVRIMVPAEATAGTHYAKIKISDGAGGDEISLDARADIAGDGYSYGGKVVSQGIGFFNVEGKVAAPARVKNEGTAGFTAHYEVQYKNAFGLPEWKKIAEEDREVLPGAEETFEVGGDAAAIGYGFFTVEQKISYINSENRRVEAILSHAVVNLPWWSLAMAAGVVVLIIIVIVVLARARRKKAEEKAASKKSRKKTAVEVVEEE